MPRSFNPGASDDLTQVTEDFGEIPTPESFTWEDLLTAPVPEPTPAPAFRRRRVTQCHGEDFYSWGDYDRHLTECDECGDSYCNQGFNFGAGHYCVRDDYDPEDREDVDRGIYNYSYRPMLQFKGTAPYYLGVELEIGTNENDARPIYEWASGNGASDLFFCKEDGSVAGFEIVTHPMSPEWFKAFNWPGFFDMLNDQYPTYRNREPNGHGLHVHVSRTAFTRPIDLCRWSYLINRNSEHVERVARRSSSSWAQFTATPVKDSKPLGSLRNYRGYAIDEFGNYMYDQNGNRTQVIDRPGFMALSNGLAQHGGERYRALNLQNQDTVEVRVFKSTRNAGEFVDSVSLVAASVDYVRSMQPQHTSSVKGLRWQSFCDWVATNPLYAESFPTFAGIPALND